jgi:hypothetical protein
MSRIPFAATAVGAALLASPVHAHGVAGAHMFVGTMLLDDPNVADEASLPTFMRLPQASGNGPTPVASSLGIEIDKRLTENFGIGVSTGYSWVQTPGQKTANGWQNLSVTAKYKTYANPEHEFMLSLGATRTFARTGTTGARGGALDNDDTSSTTPKIYFGKGFGDLPIGWLRPLALTGTLGFLVPDKNLKVMGFDTGSGDPTFNNGLANQWRGGLSLQYSLRYLESQVKDHGLPEWVERLTPLVEVAWSSPASRPNNGTAQYLIGAGVAYTAATYAVTVEALIPGNRQSGSHAGFVAQFHLYFDDMFPSSLGKPVSQWW